MADIYEEAVLLHRKFQGKLEVRSRIKIKNRKDLTLAYTPGVAEPCRIIAKDAGQSFDLTWRGRCIAVISDGSAVLGLGNIGPEAALPVMEGKSLLMKEFAGVDSIPLVINTQDPAKIIEFVKLVAPSFAGINLEDISAPRCFQVEEALQDIGIPVFHDDQHGTAIVVTAALCNAAKVVGKKYEALKVVIVGAGAAGLATARMLLGINCESNRCEKVPGARAVGDVVVVDRDGTIYPGRKDLNVYKQAMAGLSNISGLKGSLADAIRGADAVIGVSGPDIITEDMVASMAKNSIVFAMANPVPEIMPDVAKKAGAMVVASGRSDFPNQINNVLAFPAIFRAVIDGRLTRISMEMKQKTAEALAAFVPNPTSDHIIPDPFTPLLAESIAKQILR
jgi:malate dehydrogenase (oxaloacetate-decarboxylating)